jgi:hypothetical protein
MRDLERMSWATGMAAVDETGRVFGSSMLSRRAQGRLAIVLWVSVIWAAILAFLVAMLVGGVGGGSGAVPVARSPEAIDVPLGLQAVAQRVLGGSEHEFWVGHRGGVLVAAGGGISSVFGSSGVRMRAAGRSVDLRLIGVGRGGRLASMAGTLPVEARNVVRYRRGGLVEWYRNGPLGLEQGFTVLQRLAARERGPLIVALQLGGTLKARLSRAGVAFVSRNGAVRLRYGGLSATEATGRRLPASLELSRGRLLLRVWDRGARYPVRVDPFFQQGEPLSGSGERGPGSFGSSVALSADGSTALIGGYSDGASAGAAWVFTRSGSTWKQQGEKLTGSGEVGESDFGSSVALSSDGNTAIIGGPRDNEGAGAAWVFTRSGSTWTQQGEKLTGSGEVGKGDFGDCVALSSDGSTALIGGLSDANDLGAVWVFTHSGSMWTQQDGKLTGSGEVGEGTFGSSVALSSDGSTALVGGYSDNERAGAAWVFTRSGSAWTQQGQKLTGRGEIGAGYFGISAALSSDGNTALIGGDSDNLVFTGGSGYATGAAWVFTRSGSIWTQQGEKLTGDGESGGAYFGSSVALSADGTSALIGGEDDHNGIGSAWVFTRAGTIWAQQGNKLTASGENGPASFGGEVALSANASTALIGGRYDNAGVGAAWVFAVPTIPGAPPNVDATAGNGQATVSFTAAEANGSPITSYTVTASPGGAQASGSGSPITVTGLTNGVQYIFTVTATNGVGTGSPSGPSNAVTPTAPQISGGVGPVSRVLSLVRVLGGFKVSLSAVKVSHHAGELRVIEIVILGTAKGERVSVRCHGCRGLSELNLAAVRGSRTVLKPHSLVMRKTSTLVVYLTDGGMIGRSKTYGHFKVTRSRGASPQLSWAFHEQDCLAPGGLERTACPT